MKCKSILVCVFFALQLSVRPSAADPRPLRDGLAIRQIARIAGNTIRIAKDPRDNALYTLTRDGVISRVNLVPGDGASTLEPLYTRADHGGSAQFGIGFAIGPDGTIYLLVNGTDGNTGSATLRKGVLTGSERAWSTLATTEPYPLNGRAFDDHAFNALAVSPDNRWIYVSNGSRTDHGEEQSNRGSYPGLRETPINSAVFRLPVDGENIVLPNDEIALREAGYFFADGVRNAFDLAFAPNGDLFATDNGPDADYAEELNWLREGHHYGFPWRLGGLDNPQRFADYDPDADLLITRNSTAVSIGAVHNDPEFPPPPMEFTDPVVNLGPDADRFRDPASGEILDASDLGVGAHSFTPHRSPLGLVFDVEGALGGEYAGAGFVLSIGGAIAGFIRAFNDPDEDLLHLELEKVGDNYQMRATRIVEGFNAPIDAEIVGKRIYVVEFQPPWLDEVPRFLWEITLPAGAATAVAEAADGAPDGYALEQNYPNPFNPSTTIEYRVVGADEVELIVFNVAGQKVRTLVAGHRVAGRYVVQWDGTDDMGRDVASGAYIYRLKAGSFEQTRQLMLLK